MFFGWVYSALHDTVADAQLRSCRLFVTVGARWFRLQDELAQCLVDFFIASDPVLPKSEVREVLFIQRLVGFRLTEFSDIV